MKLTLNPFTSIVVSAGLLLIFIPITQARATTQAPTTSQAIAPSSTNNNSLEIDNLIDLLSQIVDFFATIPGVVGETLSDTLGDLGIPDLISVLDDLEDNPTSDDEGATMSEVLESRQGGSGNGSFAIRSDLANQAVRENAIGLINAASLSENAQQDMVQRAQIAEQATNQNTQLGQESQNLDVTQQILQNVSMQSALNGQLNQQLLQESQQARIDRAISNSLSAQIAKEMSAVNIADRRQEIGTKNMSVQQTGLISLPGGYYLGRDSSTTTP